MQGVQLLEVPQGPPTRRQDLIPADPVDQAAVDQAASVTTFGWKSTDHAYLFFPPIILRRRSSSTRMPLKKKRASS
jgi:hypothetical protein